MGRPVDAQIADRVLAIDVRDADGGQSAILPSSGAVLGVRIRGAVRAGDDPLAPAELTGIQPVTRVYGYAPRTRSILVRFTPQGARCLGVPASHLASARVGLADLVAPAVARELVERVAEAPTVDAAVTVVEAFLARLPFARDPLVERAIALLDRAGDDASIRRIARTLGLGERQLERRFRDRVGLAPKRFASLRRFERAVALAPRARSLTEAALAAGYYDQSHLIRDFRRFAGVSPGAWLREMSGPSK